MRKGPEEIRSIIGIETVNYVKDGKPIKGERLHTTEDIPVGRGIGKKGDKFFLSDAKLAMLGFTPAVGDNVAVYYNRYGNVSHITQVDDLIDLG